MDLRLAATWFDQSEVRDAYTNTLLFLGQTASFTDQQSAGSIFSKRSLELDPSFVIPARRAVAIAGQNWVVGQGLNDEFMGDIIRTVYIMMKSNILVTVRTAGQAAINAGGTQSHAHQVYLRSTVDGVTSANFDPYYEVYMASTETSNADDFLIASTGEAYIVRSKRSTVDGFNVLEADLIDAPAYVSFTAQSGVYDPVLDTYSGATLASTGMLVDAHKVYKYDTAATPKYTSGDHVLVTRLADQLAVGREVTIDSQAWRVLYSKTVYDGVHHLVRLA